MPFNGFLNDRVDLYSPNKTKSGPIETKAWNTEASNVFCRHMKNRDRIYRGKGGFQKVAEAKDIFLFFPTQSLEVGWRVEYQGKKYLVEDIDQAKKASKVHHKIAICRFVS